MSSLPLPIRLAAGLAAIAVERARKLPRDVSEWPMTAVSQALQVSMRVQQRITELAIKGDEALAGLREPDEEPPWAVFDEDLPRPSYQRPQHAAWTEPAGPGDVPESGDLDEIEPVEDYDLGGAGTTTPQEQSWFEALDEVYEPPGDGGAVRTSEVSGRADAPDASAATDDATTARG